MTVSQQQRAVEGDSALQLAGHQTNRLYLQMTQWMIHSGQSHLSDSEFRHLQSCFPLKPFHQKLLGCVSTNWGRQGILSTTSLFVPFPVSLSLAQSPQVPGAYVSCRGTCVSPSSQWLTGSGHKVKRLRRHNPHTQQIRWTLSVYFCHCCVPLSLVGLD